jgi:hypothetical protein
VLIFNLSWCLLFIHPLLSAIQLCVNGVVDRAQSNSRCVGYTNFEFTPVDTRFMKIEMLQMFPAEEDCQTHPHPKAPARAPN